MKSMREFLLEQPQLVKKDLNVAREIPEDTFSSTETLSREYDKKFTIGLVDLYSPKQSTFLDHIRGYIKVGDKHQLVFQLFFYKYNHQKILFLGKKILQVKLVAMNRDMRGIGIATSVYKKLVDMGYHVVSDHVQYLGGQGVWRKLAKDRNYKITVYDIGKSSYIPNGEPIVYDGHNIPDEMIWDEQDFAKNVLMILSK